MASGSSKKPILETYGKTDVFTGQRKRERSTRRRKVFFIVLVVLIAAIAAWFAYKAIVSGQNPFIDPFALPVPKS